MVNLKLLEATIFYTINPFTIYDLPATIYNLCSKVMNELDELWTQMISEAAIKAQAAGRGDVADYLSLKAGNDLIRAAAAEWLLDSAKAIAEELNRQKRRAARLGRQGHYV